MPTSAPRRNPVRYGLRFQILPDARAAARARELIAFCRRCRIPAVHLFMNAEEWNRGHMTEPEIRRHLALFRRLLPRLRAAGLSVHLNPWCTTLHTGRGRRLRAGQAFARMVSPTGRVAPAVASFACPHWRRYLAGLYGRMAALGFETLWVEDDFRYHNHGDLDWGGDFSPAMLRRFAAAVGRPVTREELVRAVLRPGRPHPWRARWLALWRACQEETAAALRDAVAAANPRAQLGLMSSMPETHAAEGRDWTGLFRALAIGGRAVHRPTFACYSENPARPTLADSVMALDIQKRLRPNWVEAHPEVENYTFGRFHKSNTLTFAQMALAKIMGSEGLLLDLHPMTGNGVFEEQGIADLLRAAYPALAWLGERFPRALAVQGAGVPFRPDAPLAVRLPPGARYDDLVCSSRAAGHLLAQAGVACCMAEAPGVNLLWGRAAWSYGAADLRRLLSGGLWLDAEAAAILARRGFGRALGVRLGRWLERDRSLYAVERALSPRSGQRPGFCASVNHFRRLLALEAAPGAEAWTAIEDCMGRRVGAGLTVSRNAWGGRVAVSAVPLNAQPGAWNMTFQRQALVQRLVRRLAGRRPPVMVAGAPHVLPLDLRRERLRRVVLLNLWPDPARVEVRVPGAARLLAATALRPLRRPEPMPCRARRAGGGLAVSLATELPYCGFAVLEVGDSA